METLDFGAEHASLRDVRRTTLKSARSATFRKNETGALLKIARVTRLRRTSSPNLRSNN